MIERTLRQAARFVTSNYSRYVSVTQMLTDLNWPTLARYRDELKAITMFKIINHLVDIPANPFLTSISTVHSTRGHMRFMQPMTRIDSYMYSFFPSAIKIWNNLPQNVIDFNDIDQFKQKLAIICILVCML